MITESKSRPIIFSADMVRAILDGRKSQTRRIIKPQFNKIWGGGNSVRFGDDRVSVHVDIDTQDGWKWVRCPYGKPGDLLWVKETFVLECWEDEPKFVADRPTQYYPGDGTEWDQSYWLRPHYKATDPAPDLNYEDDENDDGEPKCKWRSSMLMPRWVSRITLKIIDIHVERLQDISRDDAMAEGVEVVDPYAMAPDLPPGMPAAFKDYRNENNFYTADPIRSYRSLWELIHDKKGPPWFSNPFVWVVKFIKA